MKHAQRIVELVPAGTPAEEGTGLDRRQALKLMAASLALATGACSRPDNGVAHPFVRMPEAGAGSAEALYYATAFVRDGYAHGVLVGTRDGRPVKVEGNPRHPAGRGRTDLFAQASVLELWDPDRSQAPLLRTQAGQPAATAAWSGFEAEWQARAAALDARRGEGLHLLLAAQASPTLQDQLARWAARWPAMRLYRHAPLADGAAEAGARLAFGRPLRAVPDLASATLVLALGSDPFHGGPAALAQAADWAAARSSAGPRQAARLVAIETTPGLFGARADARLALPPAGIDALVLRLAAALGVPGCGAAPAADPDAGVAAFEQRLLQWLRQAGAGALLLPGAALQPATHACVHALHAWLGATGRTLRLVEPDPSLPGPAALADAARAGTVDTLLVLGANPAYSAPGALGLPELLARVPFAVHAGLYADETARHCRWHLPLTHDYEQWSDARAFDGTVTLQQPAVQPLYDGRSLHELVALLSGDALREGRGIVRRHWRALQRARSDEDFERLWHGWLREGFVADTAAPAVAAAVAGGIAQSPAPPQPPSALVAVFAPDPRLGDGRFANNGWLQELPHPLTQVTWANPILLGPATAAALGLASGDVVTATVQGRQAQAPVWVQAAHAEGAATLLLGGGRSAAGRVGDGVGFDAFALQPVAGSVAPLTLARSGRRIELARTQRELQQHGRDLARQVPASQPSLPADAPLPSLYAGAPPAHAAPDATPGAPALPREPAWGMVVDLDACIGCNACTVACQAENNIPVVGAEQVAAGRVMHWIRIDRYDPPPEEARRHPAGQQPAGIFQPVPCMHCENAPCEIVCPVGATVHDSEGLNLQVYNRCVGTRFCSNNCPYKVRRFNFLQYSDRDTAQLQALRNPEVTVRARGVMEKCTYCVQRITRARLLAERRGTPLADGEVQTACQGACPTGAIHFGDLGDPASEIARARASPRHYALLHELGTRPRTTYLARVERGEG